MRRWVKNNSLSIVLFSLFVIFLVGQSVTGHREYNAEQSEHQAPAVGYSRYLRTGHFVEAIFENWESEFLQMSCYVLLTIWLRQKGSSESKPIGTEEDVDRDPRSSHKKDTPWPVRQGGWVLRLYENSLSLAFVSLFLLSLILHGLGGANTYNKEQMEHDEPTVSTAEYMQSARFWFESFQNWQSEFLATGSIVLFSVYLRQRGSPESKPVDAPHHETQ
jgi:hypothetical protein